MLISGLSHQAQAFGKHDLRGPLRVSSRSVQFLLENLVWNPACRRERPNIETDAGGLFIAEFHTGLMHLSRYSRGFAEIAHAIQRGAHLIARHIQFPVITRPLQQSHRLARLLHAVGKSGRRIKENAVEVSRLTLAP